MTTSDAEGLADEELVRAFVVERDIDALEELLRRHESKVYGLCYRMLGNPHDALDATQEVMIGLFRRVGSFQGQSRFTTWLYRLTANACIDLSRKRSRAPIPFDEIHSEPTIDTATAIETHLDLEKAIAQLPPDQRLVLLMRDMRGLSYEEIAEATSAPIGTVKSRIARGRMLLASLMEPTYGSGRLRDGEQ